MPEQPPFWDEKASRMVGKRVLVGKTYVRDGQVVETTQFHGIVETADERSGFALRRHDTGALEWLPPDLRAFQVAPPGAYTLRSTGEVVENPDLISNWTIERDEPFAEDEVE